MEKENKVKEIRDKLSIEEGTWEDGILLKWIQKDGIDKVYVEALEMLEEVKRTVKKMK